MSVIIRQFDLESMQEIAAIASEARNAVRRLSYSYQRDRRVFSAGGKGTTQKRGKPGGVISEGSIDDVLIYNQAGSPTGEIVQCLNPYAMDLYPDYFVRVVELDEFDNPIAVPDHYVICAELSPDQIAPVQGS